jgi:hypothetical protein
MGSLLEPTLARAIALAEGVIGVHSAAINGLEAQGGNLTQLAISARQIIPDLRRCHAAQAQAAELRDLPKPVAVFGAPAAEHAHAANDQLPDPPLTA